MFITASSTYTVPVSIDFIGEDGNTITHVLKCKFKRLTQDEIDSFFERVNRGQLTDAQVIAEVFKGWTDDTTDGQGNKLEYTPDNLAKVMNVHPTRPTIVRKFLETIQGIKAKNL